MYRREGEAYPSDLRDAEWARMAPLIPPARPGGRPRKTDLRAAMNAILYLLRTGCPWRYLPRDGFPRSTVYNIFRKFQRGGVWEAIWAELHIALRERMGREASPSAAVLDSQSVKRGGKDNQVGYAAGKKLKGRKFHALVDCEGLPMRVVVHSAAIQDRDGAGLVLDMILRRFPWLELIWADGGYNSWQVDAGWRRCPRCAWRLSSGATTCRASSTCRAAGWSSAPSLGSDATGVLPRISRTSRKLWPPSSSWLPSSSLSGGSSGRRSTSAVRGARRSRSRRRTAVVVQLKGRSPALTGTGTMRRKRPFAWVLLCRAASLLATTEGATRISTSLEMARGSVGSARSPAPNYTGIVLKCAGNQK
jgi:transposase